MIDALRFTSSSTIIATSAEHLPPMACRTHSLDETESVSPSTGPADRPPEDAAAACRELLSERHAVVVDAVRFVAARYHLTHDVADELRGRVMLHLTANDFAVLRAWRRECHLQTYLVTVITRVFLDYRNQEWGKAKPPALARRMGEVALTLWRLTHRRRLTFDEAVQTLHADYGMTNTRDELWAIYSRLPAPSGRYVVDVRELAHAEQIGAQADVLVRGAERHTLAGRVEGALRLALSGLAAEDRLVLKLFFVHGLTRAQIARALQIDQQRLYPRFVQLLSRLRASLLAQQITVADVRELVGATDLPPGGAVLDEVCYSGDPGPSPRIARTPVSRPRPRLRES
jgi:RNA polymerase sigma factor (sigma-70 family)